MNTSLNLYVRTLTKQFNTLTAARGNAAAVAEVAADNPDYHSKPGQRSMDCHYLRNRDHRPDNYR